MFERRSKANSMDRKLVSISFNCEIAETSIHTSILLYLIDFKILSAQIIAIGVTFVMIKDMYSSWKMHTHFSDYYIKKKMSKMIQS